jgi:DNA-binding transcriptional LysR family regulator
VFAVAPSHPLANAEEPLCIDTIRQYRAVAVGDTSRNFKPLTFGLQSGQAVLTVPNLQAKVKVQLAGLGCGWLPWNLIEQEVANGELLVKKTEDSTRQSSLCFAWQRGSQGKALDWWTQHLATVQLNFQPPQ